MRALVLSAVLVFSLSPAAEAQQIIYTPISPSFGGSPFNSAHILALAEINRPDPPSAPGGGAAARGASQTDFFVRQLENRILSRLSSDITDAIFGVGAEPSGTFSFNQTQLNFETLLDGTILVEIIDLTTGGITTIEVPAFLTAGGN